jgi:hypothetical protein
MTKQDAIDTITALFTEFNDRQPDNETEVSEFAAEYLTAWQKTTPGASIEDIAIDDPDAEAAAIITGKLDEE